jgi:adenosylmethionine-8-amino-7-oxononanoate aminotransferase
MLAQLDRDLIWHPYSQHGFGESLLPVARAQGCYLELEDGRRILDGISSWWVTLHGHGHPKIVEAISRQANELDHVLFAGFTHRPAIELAERLVDRAKESHLGHLTKVFYSDNGSTAVEVALKMAYQYFQNRKESRRTRFIALQGSYHGDTLGAMAASDRNGYHSIFSPLLPAVDFIRPEQIDDLDLLLKKRPGEYAAFIFEPLIQGASGMRLYTSVFLKSASELCRKAGILLIADEVFTGFYRTGSCFAVNQTEVHPDFLCLSKGISGGFLPLAATLTTENVFSTFKSRQVRDAFLHGHSYTANPIACAAAVASVDLLISSETLKAIERISRDTQSRIEHLRFNSAVQSARSIGVIGAVELKRAPSYFDGNWTTKVMQRAIELGVLLRPLGSVLYAVPPYCTTSKDLFKIYDVMEEIIHDFSYSF